MVSDGFSAPKKTSCRKQIKSKPQKTIISPNRFETLSDISQKSDQEFTPTKARAPTHTAKKKNTPPPLIIKGRPESHDEFIEKLKKLIPSYKFNIKYTKNNTTLNIVNIN